jgi:L-threonine-O-3-phosphate decarboxylase
LASLQPHHGGNLAWAAAQAGCSPQNILDFSASINPLGPPLSVLAAIQQQLGEIRAYPDPGATTLRLALSHFHQIPANWILVGNGAAELLTWGCRSLSALDRTYLLAPGFRDYDRALSTFEATVYTHPIAIALDLQNPLETLQAELEALPVDVSVGLLLNNPHNPTGQVFEKMVLMTLLARSQMLLLDEAFMDFLPSQDDYSLISEVAQHPNLVILRSLTKFYSIPGLRLGYAIGHPDILQQWQTWRDPWSVNALAIAAGIAAIRDQTFQAQTHHWLAAAKPRLFEGLAQLPGLTPIPGVANFLLVRCDCSVTQLQVDLLKQYQILIRDCMSFAELGDHFFRVAVRTEAENERLLEALAQTLAKMTD